MVRGDLCYKHRYLNNQFEANVLFNFTQPDKKQPALIGFAAFPAAHKLKPQKSHSKNIRREDVDFRVFFFPCMGRKACLLAGMLQKRLTIPSVLCCDLW